MAHAFPIKFFDKIDLIHNLKSLKKRYHIHNHDNYNLLQTYFKVLRKFIMLDGFHKDYNALMVTCQIYTQDLVSFKYNSIKYGET